MLIELWDIVILIIIIIILYFTDSYIKKEVLLLINTLSNKFNIKVLFLVVNIIHKNNE